MDAAGEIVAANPIAELIFGYSREEIVGRNISLLVPPTGETLTGREHECAARRRSGEEFPIRISVNTVDTARGPLMISIIRDVTSQRQAESRFRGLLESAPDGIVVVDGSGRIFIVNSQTERMFGYSREELLGQRIEMLVPERFRDTHLLDRQRYISDPHTRPMGAGLPLTGRTKSGEEFPVEISLSPLQQSGQESLVMSIIRDITGRRRAEEQIQASLREKEALLREIHHRVKNNLQITSSLLRLQAGTIDDPQARELFESTQNRIRSIALVHEKLYQSTNIASIDFADYIRTLADLLFRTYTVDTSAIALRIDTGALFLSVETAIPCGLIANELLSNAMKHAFPQGQRGTIQVSLAQHEGSAELVIADDGAGLPADIGFDARDTLGLQLVRQLAQQIDASIEINRDRGTSFRITFPLSRRTHG